jgi:hypothetical protein
VEHDIDGFTTPMAEVRPVKKARVHEGDHGAEEGLGLVKLVDRRRVDVEKLVTHIAHLEKEARSPDIHLSAWTFSFLRYQNEDKMWCAGYFQCIQFIVSL